MREMAQAPLTRAEQVAARRASGASSRHRGENRRTERQERLARTEEQAFRQLGEMTQDEVNAYILKALESPANYGRMILGLDIFPKQEVILEAINRFPRTAIAGCNSSGKTFSVVVDVMWLLTVEDRIAILQIAPTESQSKGIFWREMRRLYTGSPLARQLLGNAEMRSSSFEVDENRYCMTVAPGDNMNIRGFHDTKMLFIMDEGNGINASYFDSIEGIGASGEMTQVMLGNPTESSGIYYDAFEDDDLGWHQIYISCFDSPNITSLQVPPEFNQMSDAPGEIDDEGRRKVAYLTHLRHQYLAKRDRMPDSEIEELQILRDNETIHQTSRMFVADGYYNWARKSDPSWFSRVLGVFPPESEHQLFSRTVLDHANELCVWEDGAGVMCFGVDPAGMGQNEFVVYGVQMMHHDLRHRLTFKKTYEGDNALDLAAEDMRPYLESGQCLWINVDRVGVGDRVAIDLRRWADMFGVPVYGFVAQQQSTNPQLFRDIRAQAYHYVRDLLTMQHLTGLDDTVLRRQMLSIHYEVTNRGQLAMESKVKMEKRGVASPDRADALIYACFPLMNLAPWQLVLGA